MAITCKAGKSVIVLRCTARDRQTGKLGPVTDLPLPPQKPGDRWIPAARPFGVVITVKE